MNNGYLLHYVLDLCFTIEKMNENSQNNDKKAVSSICKADPKYIRTKIIKRPIKTEGRYKQKIIHSSKLTSTTNRLAGDYHSQY